MIYNIVNHQHHLISKPTLRRFRADAATRRQLGRGLLHEFRPGRRILNLPGLSSQAHSAADIVEMPSPVGGGPQVIDLLPADHCGKHRAEPVPPEPDCLMANIDPRSASKSSPLRHDSGYFTDISTTRRMTSGELSNQRNGLVDLAMP